MNSNYDDDRFGSTKNMGSLTVSLMEGSEYPVIYVSGTLLVLHVLFERITRFISRTKRANGIPLNTIGNHWTIQL